ncbi:GIY-YIG nuclease family protein [Rufibacter immobilis]
MKDHNYFVYIISNPGKSVLYTGVTNDLEVRLQVPFRMTKVGEEFRD